jgi:hypothetical protein
MLHFELALWPFITVAIVNFILSWLYYSPLAHWFKAWQIGVGVDPAKQTMTEEEQRMMPFLFGGAFLSTILLFYGLQVVVHSVGAKDFLSGAVIGVVLWAAFSVTHSLSTLFEGRKPQVLMINTVLYLVTYAGFGGLVAAWN